MKRTRPHRHVAAFLAALGLLAALCFPSCSSTRRGVPDARTNAELQAPRVGVDSAGKSSAGILPTALPASPQIADTKPSLFNRATDAIGLSTPEGRAARQQRKDARAAVPRSIGKGAVYAPLATDVVNAYKPRQAVAVARDSATLQVASNAVAGRGNTVEQTATTQEAPGAWATFIDNLTGPLGWLLAAAGLLMLLAWRAKRNNPMA